MRFLTISLIFLTSAIFGGCGSSTGMDDDTEKVEPRGNRILTIDVNEAEGETYDDVINRANSVGAEIFSISIQWDELETAPEVYSPTVDLLGIANLYYPPRNAKVALMIGPIDTNNDRLPSDLKGKPYDDTAVINRYKRLLDYVFSKIPEVDLALLSIGNEVDGTLGSNPDTWRAYKRFFDEVSVYARSLRPGLKVGVKVTFGGLTGSMKEHAVALNEKSDLVLTTHYPLNHDFTMQDPSVVNDVFDEIVAEYSTHPIWFMELGYASSSLCNSSDQKQGEFIREVFKGWDKHHQRIEYISFSIMSDRSQESVEEFGRYYGLSDQVFLEYLRTLGLRTYPNGGEDKEGWRILKEEAKKRGW